MDPTLTTIVLHRYWIVDERTGKRRLTRYHLTADDAAGRFPGARPDPNTREERSLGAYSKGVDRLAARR